MRVRPQSSAAAEDNRWRDLARISGLFLAYALLTVWWSWPAIWSWDSVVAYRAGGGFDRLIHADFYLILWTLCWVSHALATDPLALFDGNTFFPAKLSAAYSEHMLGVAPLFAPAYLMTGNPVFAVNLMTALTYPLAALFTYLLARLFMGHASAALAGFFYAFTIGRYVTPPHFQCVGVQYFPLILLGIEQWLRRARPRDAVLLVAAIALQALTSAYFLYAVLLMVCPFTLAALWHHRAQLDRRRVTGLVVAAAAAAGIVVAGMWPYLVLRAQGLVTSYDDTYTSLGLIPFFASLAARRFLAEHSVGAVGYVLALLALLLAHDGERCWAKRVAVLLVVVGCVTALGPQLAVGGVVLWSPYAWLRDLVPGFATIRGPVRFMVVAQLGLALLAGLGADTVLRGVRPRTAVLASSVLALAALFAMTPFPERPLRAVPVGRAIPPAYGWLRAHGGGRTLFEVPPGEGFDGQARRAYLSTAHWQPIVEGYAGNSPQHRHYLFVLAWGLPSDRALQRMVDVVDVGWILVHRDQLGEKERARWDGDLPGGLERAGAWGDDILYRVTRTPVDDRRARLVSATETLNGLAIAPVDDDCAGEVAFAGWTDPPDDAAGPAGARLRISNHSARAWPAFGFLPHNLVALEGSVIDAHGKRVGSPWRARLDDDVVPGQPLPSVVHFHSPRLPGSYTLRLRVVQLGSDAIERCVPALEIPFTVAPPAAGAPLAYTDNGDGTVTDANTGLMWEKLDDNNTGGIHDRDTSYEWNDAFAVKIAALNLATFAGHTDWRLPDVQELQSIINYETASPAVSAAFNTACMAGCTVTTCSCTRSNDYWSSSSSSDAPTAAWTVDSDAGYVGTSDKTTASSVRAVRGGS